MINESAITLSFAIYFSLALCFLVWLIMTLNSINKNLKDINRKLDGKQKAESIKQFNQDSNVVDLR